MKTMMTTSTVWTVGETEIMRLNTARSAAVVKIEATETVNTIVKTISNKKLVALQMSLGYEFCHQALCIMVPETYSHFH